MQLILALELICNDIIRKVTCHPSSIIDCSSIYHISYIISPNFKILLLKVMTSGMTNSHSVAGGVYMIGHDDLRGAINQIPNIWD